MHQKRKSIRKEEPCISDMSDSQKKNHKTKTLFKVRTAANRSAGFGDEQKSCNTEIAGDNSDEVVRGNRTIAEAAS